MIQLTVPSRGLADWRGAEWPVTRPPRSPIRGRRGELGCRCYVLARKTREDTGPVPDATVSRKRWEGLEMFWFFASMVSLISLWAEIALVRYLLDHANFSVRSRSQHSA